MVESIKPIAIVRYILIMAGLFVTFNNLFDCIHEGAELYHYMFYVVLIFALTMLLVFIHHNGIVSFVMAIVGLIAIYDTSGGDDTSYGFIFIAFSSRIADNMFYRVVLYLLVCLAVVANHTLRENTPSDTVNVLIVYFAILLLDYLLYNVKK